MPSSSLGQQLLEHLVDLLGRGAVAMAPMVGTAAPAGTFRGRCGRAVGEQRGLALAGMAAVLEARLELATSVGLFPVRGQLAGEARQHVAGAIAGPDHRTPRPPASRGAQRVPRESKRVDRGRRPVDYAPA